MDSWTAEDLKAGMFPGFQQINMIGSYFTFREKQGKDFGSEDFFQIFEPNGRGDLKVGSRLPTVSLGWRWEAA